MGVLSSAFSAVTAVPRAALSVPAKLVPEQLSDLAGQRSHRRMWARKGRAYLEVRGLMERADPALRRSVTGALRRLDGVTWAEVNAVTGEVLVAFDEGRVSLDRLAETLSAVEEAHELADEPFPEPGHPADRQPIVAGTLALASDVVALGFATTAGLLRVPRLPVASRAAVAVFDTQPRLRKQLHERLGRHGTDLVLALSNAAMHGLTQEPAALGVDIFHRTLQLTELRERYTVWCSREKDLCVGGLPEEPLPRTPRPGKLPPGPIQRYSDRISQASLGSAGGALALTRSPGTAAEILLATVPHAAKSGREAFAATLGHDLARQGVLPLNGAAFRKLDRITAAVIDSKVLCEPRLEVLDASDPGLWRQASRLLRDDLELEGRPDSEGRRLVLLPGQPSPRDLPPEGIRLEVHDRQGERLGTVLAGARLHPMAESVLAAARESGLRILLTAHATTDELVALADTGLPADVSLTEHVRRVQEEGHGVLLVTGGDSAAGLAADVAVGVLNSGAPACWGADLVCGPSLEPVWRILLATGAAKRSSSRSVTLAMGGSSMGSLLIFSGRRRRPGLSLAPVPAAALCAQVAAIIAAKRVSWRPMPESMPRVAWHAMDADDASARALEMRSDRIRRARSRPAPPVRFAKQVGGALAHELRDPLTPVLVLGAAASAVVGSGVDAGLVGGVMVGNAVISGFQRVRAERALSHLVLEQRPPGRRVSNDQGETEIVPATELRLGDVISLGPSDLVPADGRLLSAEDLEMDESSLTGESQPVQKSLEATPGAELAERSCMVFEGTTVLSGRATAVVVAVGEATQTGRAAALAGGAPPPGGVQKRLNEITRIALPATGLAGLLVTVLSMVRGVPVRGAISSGVSVSIAAVPEGLPLVATVAQLAAARRLSRQGVLVRSSRTLGTMGQVDTLCLDKTGTLTQGRLSVTKLSGPVKDLKPDGGPARRLLTTAARTCPNDGPVRHATDRAVAEAAKERFGQDDAWEPFYETPFETSRGYAAAAGLADGKPYVAVKGAPEIVLRRCARMVEGRKTRPFGDDGPRDHVRKLAEQGLRVLAVAEAWPSEEEFAEPEKLAETMELTLVGFVGISDALRPEAAESIEMLTDKGIRVVMITGDHPVTAQAIAADLGIPDAGRVLTGKELDKLAESDRNDRIAETSVFARVGPEQKVRIVRALQKAGRTVAMTGDGTNDAAAIRRADVGIGVGSGDSPAARSAADLILPGADLPGIVRALLEGRALWNSVRNAVSILVGGNVGEVAFTVYGTATGGRAPLTTRQLLLVNTLTDMMPALAVSLAPPDGEPNGDAAQPDSALGDPMTEAIVVRGLATAAAAVLAWQVGRFTGRKRRADTMGLAALVLTQLAQTLQAGGRNRPVVVTCAASVLLLAAVIETPGVSQFFGCTPLGPVAWSMVTMAAAAGTGVSIVTPRLLPAVVR